jgi:hypothetical protein
MMVVLSRIALNSEYLAAGMVEISAYRVGGVNVGIYVSTFLLILIAVYAIKTNLDEFCCRFVLLFSLAEFINHILLAMLFFAGQIVAPLPRWMSRSITVAIAMSLYAIVMFSFAVKLGKLKKGAVSMRNVFVPLFTALFCTVLFFVLPVYVTASPYQLWFKIGGMSGSVVNTAVSKARDVLVLRLEDTTPLTSNIFSVRVSTDGKYIAMGGDKDLTVWDVESRELLLRDETMFVRSVRFSDSGKYLAAVGTPISNDYSCVALYEVDGFKRLSQIYLEPDMEPGKKTVVMDIAFRPDEKSMIYAYYSYYDRDALGVMPEDVKQAMEKNEEDQSGRPVWSPTCVEVAIASGEIIAVKLLDDLRLLKTAIESLRFALDASFFAYVDCFPDEKIHHILRYRNFILCDTSTWQKRIIRQDDLKYEILSSKKALNGKRLPEYNMDLAKKGKIYFTYELMIPREDGLTSFSSKHVLEELDTNNETSRDIANSMDTKAYVVFKEIAISPDGKILAAVGTRGGIEINFCVIFVNLESEKEPKLIMARSDSNVDLLFPINIAWTNNEQLAVITEFGTSHIKNKQLKSIGRFFYLDAPNWKDD